MSCRHVTSKLRSLKDNMKVYWKNGDHLVNLISNKLLLVI